MGKNYEPNILFEEYVENIVFTISGNSAMEYPFTFYDDLKTFLEGKIIHSYMVSKPAIVVFDYEYYNSSSLTQIYELFLILDKYSDLYGKNMITIHWIYIDEDDKSDIELLVSDLELNIKYIKK